MPKLTDQQDADRQYDPYSNENARDLLRQDSEAGASAGIDQAEAYANDPANSSSNIQAANQAEQTSGGTPNQFGWDESAKGGKKSQTTKARLKGFIKKRGALLGIGGGFLGVSTLLLMFLSPSLLLVQMSEVLNSKFNDQLAALDARSTLIMKKKLNTQVTKGFCGPSVTIKCKYRTISKNQAKRLTAAGLVPVNGEDVIEGRGKPTAFTFNGERISANELLGKARTDPALRSALMKGYNPGFAAWADANAFKMLSRFGIKKSSSVDPSNDKEKMRRQLADTAKGAVEGVNTKRLQAYDSDGNAVDDANAAYFESEDGTRYDTPQELAEARRTNNLIDEQLGRSGLADAVDEKVLKVGMKSVLTATGFGAGAIDSLCTAWTFVRVAGFAAKIYQQRQLIRYAYEFQKQADMIRAGDGKAELSTFFSDILTSTNANGKAATDSLGYMWAAFGDTFKPNEYKINKAVYTDKEAEVLAENVDLQNETSRFVNGQLVSTSIMADLARKVSDGGQGVDAADKTCKFVKSWKGQALVIAASVAGAIAAFFSGGATLTVGTILNGAAGMTVSVIFALLQPKLIDMAKGEVIKGDENGNEAGNAIVSGSGGINAQASQTRGLPVQTKEDYVAYHELSKEVAASYDEVDRYERSPFDPTSKNTFVGSVVASLIPSVANSRSVGSALLNVSSLITSTAASVISPQAGAAAMTMDEISQCDDHEYSSRNLAADPFCNLRYGMSQQDLAIDPEEVVDYMLANCDGGCINSEEDPTAKPGSDYESYIETCIERETSIGDAMTGLSGSGEGGDAGDMCIDGNSGADEKKHTMFRLFYIDTTVDDGMEGDFGVQHQNTAALSGGSQFVAASLNVWGYSHSSGNYKQRMDASIANLQSNNVNIAGLQEFQKPQREYFLEEAGATYDIVPKTADYDGHLGENPIIWDKSRFELVEDGVMPDLKYFNGSKLRVPWVKLRDIATTQEFYVLNTHDPAKPENAIHRYQNALQHVKFIDSLKEKDGLPIVFTGDFNSGYSVRTSANTTYQGKAENLTYCILTNKQTMNNTFDLQEKRDVTCPNPGNDNAVDHIYISPSMQLSKYWKTTNRGIDGNGSDSHDTHFADLVIPGGTVSNGAGTEFVIGSYNQKRSLSAAAHTTAVNNIVNWKMDVVGTQEDSNPKFTRYKQQLGDKGYGVFPTTLPQQVNQTCAGSQAIFFNKSKFAFQKGEFLQFPRYPGQAADCGGGERSSAGPVQKNGLPDVWTNTPIVWLRDVVTEQIIIVINTHGVANVALAEGIQPAKARYESAQIYVKKIQQLKAENPGIPIFFTGDFNEGTGVRTSGNVTFEGKHQNLLYCMFAQNKLMLDAEATYLKKGTNCPNPSIGGVDYIYHSPEATVTNFTIKSREAAASDHPVIFARMVVQGSGGVGAGDITWPVAKKWWDADRNDFLGAHPTYSGTFTSPYEKGIAADIGSPPDGSPVYAMAGGKVTRLNLCGDNDGMEIESTINGKKLYIAYGHGVNPRFKVGETVKAGQQILNLGAVGCQVSGGHLHVDMSYDGQHICPQDVFLALGNGQTPNFESYKSKGVSPCRR